MHKLYLCEGLSPTAWWSLSLPPGSQKAQINDWWVIDLSVLYSFNLGTYLLIQLSMVAWTTSLISVHGNTVPIFLEYILYLCMLFVVVPNLFAAVACHYGIASADWEMRLCSMVSLWEYEGRWSQGALSTRWIECWRVANLTSTFVGIGINSYRQHDPRAGLTTGCVQWQKCLVENMVFSPELASPWLSWKPWRHSAQLKYNIRRIVLANSPAERRGNSCVDSLMRMHRPCWIRRAGNNLRCENGSAFVAVREPGVQVCLDSLVWYQGDLGGLGGLVYLINKGNETVCKTVREVRICTY